MTSQRDVPTVPDNSLAAFVTSALPEGENKSEDATGRGMSEDSNYELKKHESPLLNVGFQFTDTVI